MIYRLFHYVVIKIYKKKSLQVMFYNMFNLPHLIACLHVNVKNSLLQPVMYDWSL